MFATLTTVVHVFISVLLICIVLLQQGKGADAGATFGGGGNTVFGATGADNLLTRVTTFLAIFFMTTSVILAAYGRDAFSGQGELIKQLPSADAAPISAPVSESETAPQDDAPAEGAGESEVISDTTGSEATAPATAEEAAPPAENVAEEKAE